MRDGVRDADVYLSRVKELESLIEFDRERIKQLRAGMDGVGAITYDGPRVKSSPRKDRLEQMVIKMERAVEAYSHHEEILLIEWSRIVEEIKGMDRPLHAEILTMRYLHGMTLVRIARSLNYSESHVRKESAEALQAFAEKYLQEG